MENKLMLKAACFLAVCLMRSLTSGKGQDLTTPEVNRMTSTTPAEEKLEGSRNESVEMGASVTLHCSNSEISWKDMIYVIWKINLRGKNCRVAFSKNDPAHNTCQDGKKLIGTVDGAYNLIIPNFTVQDEGNYICDVSYQSWGYNENIYVSAWAYSDVHGWLETEKGDTVAVCTATSRPAASIHLETLDGKYFTNDTQTSKSNEGTYTVKSRFYLPQKGSNFNLTCVASYLKDRVTRFNFPDNQKQKLFTETLIILLIRICCIMVLVFLLYISYKVFTVLRKKCRQSI